MPAGTHHQLQQSSLCEEDHPNYKVLLNNLQAKNYLHIKLLLPYCQLECTLAPRWRGEQAHPLQWYDHSHLTSLHQIALGIQSSVVGLLHARFQFLMTLCYQSVNVLKHQSKSSHPKHWLDAEHKYKVRVLVMSLTVMLWHHIINNDKFTVHKESVPELPHQ